MRKQFIVKEPYDYMEYKVVLTLDEDHIYTAEALELPGCISQGKTRQAVLENIKDAIRGYLASLKKHPEEQPIRVVEGITAVSV